MNERTFDEVGTELPWIGSPEAVVVAIESLIFHAIGGEKTCSPVRLRYWLNAYYQARKAAELEDFYAFADRIWKKDRTPHQSTAPTASPQGEARSVEIQVDQFGYERQEGDGAAVSAPP